MAITLHFSPHEPTLFQNSTDIEPFAQAVYGKLPSESFTETMPRVAIYFALLHHPCLKLHSLA